MKSDSSGKGNENGGPIRAIIILFVLVSAGIVWGSDAFIAINLAAQVRSEVDTGSRIHDLNRLRSLRGRVAAYEMKDLAQHNPDEQIRALATYSVRQAGYENGVQFFREQTSDPSRLVRLAAFTQLAGLGDVSGRPLALQTLGDSGCDDDERLEAIRVLGAVGEVSDLPRLLAIQESTSGHNYMRLEAYQARRHIQLLRLPDAERLAFLLTSLDDPDAEARNWAFLELYSSRDPRTNSVLRKYLTSPGHRGYSEGWHALGSRSGLWWEKLGLVTF